MEQNIFVVIVSKLLRQKKYLKSHFKDCFKFNDKQIVIMPKKGEYVKGKNYETKTNPWVIMQILKVFYCQKLMESKIQKSFIYRNIKNILLGVMAFN